jgi:hypothetical protein
MEAVRTPETCLLQRDYTDIYIYIYIYIYPNAAFFLIKNLKSRFSWKSLRQEIVYFVKRDSCTASDTFQMCVSTSRWSVNVLAGCGFHYCSDSFIVTQFISPTRRHPSWMSSNCDETMQYCADSRGGGEYEKEITLTLLLLLLSYLLEL